MSATAAPIARQTGLQRAIRRIRPRPRWLEFRLLALVALTLLLGSVSLNATVNSQWAALDAQVMRKAAWAPYVNRQFTDFFSTDIDLSCYVNHVLYQFDFSRICKK